MTLTPPSLLESFRRGDEDFFDLLDRVDDGALLVELVERWKRDDRPWARARHLEFATRDLGRPGHDVLVKRLFKHAHATQDDEALAHWLVAFDRFVRRRVVIRGGGARGRPVARLRTIAERPRATGASAAGGVRTAHPGARPFSLATRHYLRRRAWRAVRALARTAPERYLHTCGIALRLYGDADLAAGQDLLDARSLILIAFAEHPALRLSGRRAHLVAGRSLAELAPAPREPHLWRGETGRAVLLELVGGASSHLVRTWASELLERDHAAHLRRVGAAHLGVWLTHAAANVRAFGLRVLGGLEVAASPSVGAWITWCERSRPEVSAALCGAFLRSVPLRGLPLEELVEVACARPSWLAEAALEVLRTRPVATSEERAALAQLGAVRCEARAEELVSFALDALDQDAGSAVEACLANPRRRARRAAIRWFDAHPDVRLDARALRRLATTTAADVRAFLLRRLASEPRELRRLDPAFWSALALDVEGGNRWRARASSELASAVVREPSRADLLLPVLATCLRSSRAAERRAALAGLARVRTHLPELADAVDRLAPEVHWPEAAAEPTS